MKFGDGSKRENGLIEVCPHSILSIYPSLSGDFVFWALSSTLDFMGYLRRSWGIWDEADFIAFGFAASLVESIPIAGLFFSIPNRIGAAMM